MKKTLVAKALSTALMSAALLVGCSTTVDNSAQVAEPVVIEKPEPLKNQEAERVYVVASQALFRSRPMSASMYGLDRQLAGGYYTNRVDMYDAASEASMRDLLREVNTKLAGVDFSATPHELENKQVMQSIIRYYSGHPDFAIGYIDTWMGLSPFIVNQINGPLIDIPSGLQNQHQINNLQDAEDYIKRMKALDDMVKSVAKKLNADAQQNWIAPKTNLKGAIVYLDNFLASDKNNHPLVKAFAEKLEKVESITPQQRLDLLSRASHVMEEEIFPAFEAMKYQVDFMLDEAPAESGIWAQPNGDKFYKDAIKQLADSDLSAEQIHQIGLDEVKRISAEMDAILTAQGYTNGSVGERMASLTDEPQFLYEDSEAGRAQLLADLNKYIAEITEKMPPLFATKPKYDVEVRAFPKEVQDGASGGMYNSPSLDGSKPGIYWINLKDMKAVPTFSLKTLTYHEANPGHHWQVALNLEQDSLPFLRRIAPYNAYVEGWALYSELVAYEMGMYDNDPFGNLGRLQAELFRAVRLVVDTGLHHKRWTREQAIDYMASTTGSALSDVTSEIERYMAWPGQALGYKLGMLKIVELRQYAKDELGDKFDLAAFHDLVLLGGAVPMSVLETKVKEWVAEQLPAEVVTQ